MASWGQAGRQSPQRVHASSTIQTRCSSTATASAGHTRTQARQATHLLLDMSQSGVGSAHTPPQLTWPVGQRQAPVTQVAPVGQTLPHAPQLLRSVCTFVHTPPQASGVGAVQFWQTPETQAAPTRHAVVQVPQWFGSAERSTQPMPAPQLTRPGLHTQAPASQVAVDGHAVPQVPQLPGSV